MGKMHNHNFLAVLFVCALFSMAITGSILAVEKPVGPVVYSGSNGGYELYWFYPGLHKTNLGNIGDPVGRGSCLGTGDQRNAIFTRFEFIPPILIKSVSTYITNERIPTYPGDQHTPIRLSLKQKSSQGGFSELWYATAGLDPLGESSGQIVSCPIGLTIEKSDEVWTAQEWLLGFPTAPLIGTVKWEEGDFKQYTCPMIDSTYVLTESIEEFSIGLELLQWTGGNYNSGISFRIEFSRDTADSEFLSLGSIDSDSLYYFLSRVGDGYARIIANEGGLEESSDLIFLDSSRLPKISINPKKLECKFIRDISNYFSFDLSNSGGSATDLKIYYDSSLFTLDNDSLHLAANQKKTIRLTFDPPTSGSIFGSNILICPDNNSYPVIYHIIFREDKKLDVEESTDNLLPEIFHIGEPHPNPFNGSVRFETYEGTTSEVSMEVYNILGRKVHSNIQQVGKSGYLVWDGKDQSGTETPSGIYFFRFVHNGHVIVRKGIYQK